MEEFVVEINNMLQSILDSNSETMSSMIGGAKIVAFIGATILTAFIAYDMFLGKGIDWKRFSRIIIIYFGIAFYGTFISFINAPLDLIVNTAKIAVANDQVLYKALEQADRKAEREHIENAKHQQRLQEIAATEGWVDAALTATGNAAGVISELSFFDAIDIERNLREMMIDFFQWIVTTLARMAIIILNIVRTFFLIVLSIFGIFAIAFSVYPGMEGSFFSWLQKYINVYLWLAAAYVLEGMIVRLSHSIKTMGFYTIVVDGESKFADDGTYNAALVLISLGSILGMAMVPTITSWIVNAQVGNAASKLKSKAQGSLAKAQSLGKSAAAGSAAGPAGAAAAGAAKKASSTFK